MSAQLRTAIVCLGVALLPGSVHAAELLDANSRKLSFQARLTDDQDQPLVGAHDLHFRLYDVANGGAALPNGGPFTINVNLAPEANGVVAVLIPDGDGVGLAGALFDGNARYLGLTIDAGQELQPRLLLTMVPHAMRVDYVGSAELDDNITLGDASTNGTLGLFDAIGLQTIQLSGNENMLSMNGDSGNESVRLWGPAWGQLRLMDPMGVTSVELNAGTTEIPGAEMSLNDNTGNRRVFAGGGPAGGFVQVYDAITPTTEFNGSAGEVNATGAVQIKPALSANPVGRLTQSAGGGLLETFDELGLETLSAGSSSNGGGGYVIIRQDGGGLGLQLDGDVPGQGPVVVGRNIAGDKRFELKGDDGDGSGRISLFATGLTGGIDEERIRLDGHSNDSATGPRFHMWNNFGQETVLIDSQMQLLLMRNSSGIGTVALEADSGGKGRVTTGALTITGGADFSEQFDIESAHIEPGMVVSIDPLNPGRLRVSSGAYDRTVAGIVSGAGGVDPGMLMSHNGTLADGEHPVALTGRVYCRCDASAGAIAPGDLLTTSATRGHAMKVVDHARAQGAILGKAMTPLAEGTGLVLVLVTLQ